MDDLQWLKDPNEKEAYEIGRSRGWDHANFVGAYGGDLSESPEVPPRFSDVESFFLSGWEDGVTKYGDSEYPDGTSMEE